MSKRKSSPACLPLLLTLVFAPSPQHETTIASLTAFTAKKKKKLSAYAKLNEAVCHSHENQKSDEMKSIVFSEGRFTEDQEKLGPMPGTAFWKCFTICNVDTNRQGSDGGHWLEPHLQLPIPDSILMSNVGGIRFWGFYTDSDGFVCRTSVNKKSAAEWLSRRRRKRIAELSARKPYRLKVVPSCMFCLSPPDGDVVAGE